MLIAMESTGKLTLHGGELCQVWVGRTAGGRECVAYVRPADAPAPAPEPRLLESVRGLRDGGVALARSHEADHHAGAPCGGYRVALASCLVHSLGVKGGLVFGLIEELTRLSRVCTGGCGHADTLGTEAVFCAAVEEARGGGKG